MRVYLRGKDYIDWVVKHTKYFTETEEKKSAEVVDLKDGHKRDLRNHQGQDSS